MLAKETKSKASEGGDESTMPAISKLLREPLLIFLVLGALLFGLHTLINDQPPEPDTAMRIQVTTANIDQLRAGWQRKMGRPPQPEELQGLIDGFIREEVLVREAQALGLDRDDTIVSRRLAQKMDFLAEDLALLNEPTEADVSDYFEQHPDLYRLPPRISFAHIYFSPDRRSDAAQPDAERTLNQLVIADQPPLRAPELGDPFMLESGYSLRSPQEVSQLFGQSFADALFDLAPATWQGTVVSSYGLHLVRVQERVEGRLPEPAEVREQVHQDLVVERRREAKARSYAVLRDHYEIELTEDASAAVLELSWQGVGK